MPGQARLQLRRFSSRSKLVHVSPRNIASRPEAALSPLIDSLAGIVQNLVAHGVFRSENVIYRQRFEVEVQGCDARLMFAVFLSSGSEMRMVGLGP